MLNPQKLTIMQNSITIIDLDSADYNISNIKGCYPILIKGSYLGDMLPSETGHFNDTPKTCSYGFTYNEGCEEFTLNNRDQVYELIKDITTAISKALTYRYTHEYQPGKLLNSPYDDQTNDISNAIELLSILDSIGTDL